MMAAPLPSPSRDHRSAFGLTIASDLALPELHSSPVDAAPDVDIRLGALARRVATASELRVSGTRAVLSVPGIGRYRIDDGRRIQVEPLGGAPASNVRLFLLGSAFGVLLHQRGVLPLHANALHVGDGVAAFMGASGAGKSTLAAHLATRGHGFLADDVCAVSWRDKTPVVHPGVPRLRLWRDCLERLGCDPKRYDRAFDRIEKFNVPVAPHRPPAAIPLARIYLLARAASGMRVRRLRGSEAVEALVANTYRGRYLAPLGLARRHWRACVALAGAVPVFELARPWAPALLDATVAEIETHLGTRSDAA